MRSVLLGRGHQSGGPYTRAIGDGLRNTELNHGHMTRTTPEREPSSPDFHTTSTGGHLSFGSLLYTMDLQWHYARTFDTPAMSP
ncbi:hypothetical protein TNCV_3974651 [Trichonephila clavipes]|nr:hypothetical protein TNCV_3974651 [Trichonephila clavipes]